MRFIGLLAKTTTHFWQHQNGYESDKERIVIASEQQNNHQVTYLFLN